MFNLFKKKEENPIAEIYKNLTNNQKMSIINLLNAIAISDSGESIADIEEQFLNTFIDILQVRADNCMAYLNSGGGEKLFNDLKSLDQKQKEFLLVTVWDMIICDGRPNETELNFAMNAFEKIGISNVKFDEILRETMARAKFFGLNR